MRVIAFRHEVGVELGTVRPILENLGIEVDCVDLGAGDALPDVSEAAGLIFLGGAMCANDDLESLRQELKLIVRAARVGQPVFGICLGAQLIAKALGGKVYPSAVYESGWHSIQIDRNAFADPVFGRLPQDPKVFHLHQDTFDLPPGAVRLASSADCANQAFRAGKTIYGVQFHPEMTEEMVEDWSRDLGLPPWPETPAACAAMRQTCEQLMTGWSGLL